MGDLEMHFTQGAPYLYVLCDDYYGVKQDACMLENMEF